MARIAQNLPDAIRKLLAALKQHKTCLMQSGNYWLTKISTKLAFNAIRNSEHTIEALVTLWTRTSQGEETFYLVTMEVGL